MSEFWEPWSPEVGQRVRVRVSGECDHDNTGHIVLDGAVGTVVQLWTYGPSVNGGHPYAVQLDAAPTGHLIALAAAELEPLDA